MRVREEHKQVVKKLKVKAFLEEYKLVFVEHKHLSPVKKFYHKIPLVPKAEPFNIRLYKISLMHDKNIKKLLKKLLNGIIQPNYNIFASVVLLVKKKKGNT
jgi:hypothetical protein